MTEDPGRTGCTDDTPINGFFGGDSLIVSELFKMFEAYLPPDSGNGSNVVALHYQAWSWRAIAFQDGATWRLLPGPHVEGGDDAALPSAQFQWLHNAEEFK